MQQAGTGGGGGQITPTSEGDSSTHVFQCELCKITCTSKPLLDLHISGMKHQKKLKDSATNIPNEVKRTSCEICAISCDTYEIFTTHLTGRKHLKNLKKSETPSVPHNPVPTSEPVSTPKVVEPVSTPNVVEPVSTPKLVEVLQKVVEVLQDSLKKEDKIVVSHEVKPTREICGSIRKGKRAGKQLDLETKKQKIMQKGTAPASLRACTVCNVVCNSPKVFDYHMAGQKHLAMVAKQANAQ